MSTEAWIFMVGFRVFDVGLLIVWLVWFFRLRDDGSDASEDDDGEGGGGSGPERRPRSGPGGGLPLRPGRASPGANRLRDGHRPPRAPFRRRHAPSSPTPAPARVRSPGAPARVTRRA